MDVSTLNQTVLHIRDSIISEKFTQHVVVNVAKIVNMRKDVQLSRSINSCDIINIDGMGVVWGARLLGYKIPERVAGIDLFNALIQMSAKEHLPIYLLGATDAVVRATVDKLKLQDPTLIIAGYHHGYFWDDEKNVVEKIRASGAKLLFVAITSPKKENFIDKWRQELGVTFVMGVGGTFDVISGKVMRAPLWMQNSGLEWLFRVIQEPRRMWKRYLTTNSQYAFMLLKEKIKNLASTSTGPH